MGMIEWKLLGSPRNYAVSLLEQLLLIFEVRIDYVPRRLRIVIFPMEDDEQFIRPWGRVFIDTVFFDYRPN